MNAEEKTTLKELYHILLKENNPKILPHLHVLAELIGQNGDFIALKTLLSSDSWPEAIDPHLLCDQESEIDKIGRAESILELLVEKDLKDKKFLDFGCGEGHTAYKALIQDPIISVGYDLVEFENWKNFGTFNGELNFTTNPETIKTIGPYDIILVHDVIDHMSRANAVTTLNQIKGLLTATGTVYLRTHPFCSRHATHLYHKINKAFVHLVFTAQELNDMGYDAPPTAEILYPIAQYTEIIKEAGFAISHNNILREKVEPFFKKNLLIKERIRMNYQNSSDKAIRGGGFPEFQCEQQFLDFVIKKA